MDNCSKHLWRYYIYPDKIKFLTNTNQIHLLDTIKDVSKNDEDQNISNTTKESIVEIKTDVGELVECVNAKLKLESDLNG